MSGQKWHVRYHTLSAGKQLERVLDDRLANARQCAFARYERLASKSCLAVVWKKEVGWESVYNFLNLHVPDTVAWELLNQKQVAEIEGDEAGETENAWSPAIRPLSKAGRPTWQETITKKSLGSNLDGSKAKWAPDAKRLQSATFDSFCRDDIKAMYMAPYSKCDWQEFEDKYNGMYVVGRTLRKYLKDTLLEADPTKTHDDGLLQKFKDLILSVEFEGGSLDVEEFRLMILKRNTVRELSLPGQSQEVSACAGFLHCQLHNIHQQEDSTDFCNFYQTRLASDSRSLAKKCGILRTCFLIWQGRSPSVFTYFKEHRSPALCSAESVWDFIKNHDGMCGDGKTGEARFINPPGMGQNAEYCAAILTTFDPKGKKALERVAQASNIDAAYKAMYELKVFGGPDSTSYMIKGLLAPVGIADQAGGKQLFSWSAKWGSKAMSGPNSNKWHAVWRDEWKKNKAKLKKKIPEYEAANLSGVKRLNKLLPNTVFVKIIYSRFVSAVVSAVPFLFLRVCFCGAILVSAGVSAE